MNALEAIFTRKSTRAYKPKQISEEALENILKAAFASPIGMGRYDTLHLTVVQNEALFIKIFDEAEEELFKSMGVRKNMNFGAKTLILVSSMPAYREGVDYAHAGIIIENMVIAATSMGIDSVVLGGPIPAIENNDELKNELGVPEGFKPLLAVSLGYGVEETPVKEHTISINRI